MATGEKLTDRDESRRKGGTLGGGRVSKLKWSSSDSDGDGDGESSIHFLTKAAKQDVGFHGDQQTVIFLKGPLGFLWCLVIGSFGCCRHSTRGRWLRAGGLRAVKTGCERLTGPDQESLQTQTTRL